LLIFTKPEQEFPDFYDPQQLNRYSFERNNPYKYVDPDGKEAIPANQIFFGSNNFVSTLLFSSLMRSWRTGLDPSSLSPLGNVVTRSYDAFLKSPVDVMHWSFMEDKITSLSIRSTFPKLSNEKMSDVRRDAIFGGIGIGLSYASAMSTNNILTLVSWTDTMSSFLTGGGLLENMYNSQGGSNMYIDSAQQAMGKGSPSNQGSISSSSSSKESSGGSIINKIGNTIKNVRNTIKNFVGRLFRR